MSVYTDKCYRTSKKNNKSPLCKWQTKQYHNTAKCKSDSDIQVQSPLAIINHMLFYHNHSYKKKTVSVWHFLDTSFTMVRGGQVQYIGQKKVHSNKLSLF